MIYTVAAISLIVFIVSGASLVRSSWRWIRDQLRCSEETTLRKLVRAVTGNLIPIMIGAAVLASLTLLAVSVGLFFMYRAGSFEPGPAQIIISAAPQDAPPAPPPQPAVQDTTPPVPKDELEITARVIKLTGLIGDAKGAREMARASGTAIYGSFLQNVVNDPNYRKPPLGSKRKLAKRSNAAS